MNQKKWVEGRQNLWIVVQRHFLFSGEIYPREPISNGIRFTFMSLISVTMWEYFSVFPKVCCLDIWLEGDSQLKHKHLLVRDNHNVRLV